MRAQNSKGVAVNIKLQVEDLPPDFSTKLIHQFSSTSTLWQVFKHFEKTSGIVFTTRATPLNTSSNSGQLFYEIPSVQSLGGKISDLKDFTKSLGELGFNHRQENLRVRFEVTDIPYVDAIELQKELFAETPDSEPKTPLPKTKPTESKTIEPEKVTEKPIDVPSTVSEKVETPTMPVNQDRGVKVYLPATTQRSTNDIEDNDYKPSVAQSQIYQAQIQRATKRFEGPLLTKELRESMEEEKYKKSTMIQIRVRLPDLTHIEGTFESGETIGHVVKFVRSSLNKPEFPFILFMSPPKTLFVDESKTLGRQCRFGSRVLLSMEWDLSKGISKSSFPTGNILRKDVLSHGTSISNSYSSTSSESNEIPAKKEKPKTIMSDAQKNKLLNKFIKLGKK